MNQNTGAKRQARILMVTAALIVALAAVIILLGVQQSRRGKEPLPGETGQARTTDTAVRSAEVTTADKPHQREESRPPETKKAETESTAETENASPTASQEPLPDFIAPVSGMVSKAHHVDVPVYSLTMEDYRTHTGVDIAASVGTAVRAAADGTVEEIWDDPMMGTCLSVLHSGGARSVYRNLAPETADGIRAGTAVKAGTVLGAVGESALAEIAESSHLHYELELDGVSVNPADFMLLGTVDTAYEG